MGGAASARGEDQSEDYTDDNESAQGEYLDEQAS